MAAPLRILLIEDDEADAFLIRKHLSQVRHSTYEVEWAKTYEEALVAIGRREHDAILLDYHLGSDSGLGLIQEELRINRMPTMIVVTGQEDHDIDLLTMEAGASDYLLKGELSPSLLERTIRYSIEHKQTERTIREGEALYQGIFLEAPVGITHTSLSGKFVLVNPRFCELTGYTAGELLQLTFQDLTIFGGRENDVQILDRLIDGEIETDRRAKRFKKKDGSTVWVNRTDSVVHNVDGVPSHFVSVIEDISERRKMEEERNRILLNAQCILWGADISQWVDEDGPHLDWSMLHFDEEAAQNVISLDLLEGETYAQAFGRSRHPEDNQRMNEISQQAFFSGQSSYSQEFRCKDRYEREHWLHEVVSIQPLMEGQWRGVGMVTVITERMKLEEQLRQSQKMEAIGKLAGGIAHDFNNILSVINGYSDLLLRRIDENHPHTRPLTQIHAAGEKAAGLTRQLLAFSRQQILEPKILSLNRVVHSMESMLQRLIGEDVELVTSLSESPAHVRADPTQMEQIMMNLVINARDAIRNRGRIEIQTGEVHLTSQDQVKLPYLKEGRYSLLSISDTGTGMATDVMEKIFDPFFTTKEIGKGTGLGLSTVYGIVIQSDGYIHVESEVGKGTIFRIYLPWVKDSMVREEVSIRHRSSGNGTILVAEDDAAVQEVVKATLEAEGYEVLVASDGEEALQICANNKRKIDLLLTDTVMPKMSGVELIATMKSAHPNIPILLMSGYADDVILQRGILLTETAFIHKPFSPEALFLKISECLDRKVVH